ncbi:MAG TPA: STAS/SEC14 domain-containing protein [Gemmatimonadaceae bacterium]|nr:STAS/SEC14 domain-containing protein [Gemmatimonadaceae bacterium]
MLAISHAGRIVQVTAGGSVTFAEIAVLLDDLLDDPRITEGTGILCDARGVREVPTTAELRIVARDLAPLRERGVRHIAVCADSTFVYGVARMFGVFADVIGLQVGAFRDLDDARVWLASLQQAA